MELTQLRYFQTVAEQEHFTHAAEILHIAQPSLSKSIRNLEDELGVPLFDREGRNVYLNSYGHTFLARVDHILSLMDEAQTELADMQRGVGGDLHVTSSFRMDIPDVLSNFIRSFYFEHPGIQLRISHLDNAGMAELLRTRRADLAFSTVRFNAPDIEEQVFMTKRLGIVVSRSDPLAGQKSICLAQLKDRPFISNSSSPDLQDTTLTICGQAGFSPRIVFECDAEDMIGEAVSRGLGIVFASRLRFNYNGEQPSGSGSWKRDLVFVPVEDPFCMRSVSVAQLRDCYQTQTARLFLHKLLEATAGDRSPE